MKNEKKLLKKIKESLAQMSEEKYDQIKDYKYVWFAKDGEYGGFGHYKLNLEGTPLERAEPLTYLPPMISKKSMVAAVQDRINRVGKESDLTRKKGFLPLEDIKNRLFGPHVDYYNLLFIFFEIEDYIPPKHYPSILIRVYHNSLKKYWYRHELRRAFKKVSEQDLMNKEEEEFWNDLEERVTIYRAMSGKEHELEDYGVTWTLNEDIALRVGKFFFGNLWNQAGFIVKKLEVAKTDLRAVFNQRGFFGIGNMWDVVYIQQEIPDQTFEITLLERPH